ncbi:Protein FAM64A [Fukomys damarensis]|uniref:Protein FAM64A n=1 Tax=Fukomys damarensis TaxID=885580 RepID=A0A091CSB7_FUKDA|nr:Protein FAM64A [Fukomys damarensis]
MASQWHGMRSSARRPSLLREEQTEEEVERSTASQVEPSTGALGSLCRQFQRRLPLRAVSLNLGSGPSWKRLQTPELEQQGFQAAARSAKNALGAVSQVIMTIPTICGGCPCESDSDLEPVGAGIQHLQKLSQTLDKAIMTEDK